MALFDVAEPHDTDVAGLGAKAIRDEIKTVFNTKLEGKAVEIIGGDWESVQGWPRIYYAASGAPPGPPAGADQGRLWFVSDLYEVRAHDGANWIRANVPLLDYRVPLYFGPPRRLNNANYSKLNTAVWDFVTAMDWVGMSWVAGQGVTFNKSLLPLGATIKLCVLGSAQAAAQAKLKLYDETGAADIAGSEITLPADAVTARETFSADLTAAITAGERMYTLYAKAGTATYYNILDVSLRIQRA